MDSLPSSNPSDSHPLLFLLLLLLLLHVVGVTRLLVVPLVHGREPVRIGRFLEQRLSYSC
jgi:hypothetical protein